MNRLTNMKPYAAHSIAAAGLRSPWAAFGSGIDVLK
jgi:hypothetical protein